MKTDLFSSRLYRTAVWVLPLLLCCCNRSYLSFNQNGFHGSFYKDTAKMRSQHEPVVRYYQFAPGQQVASIGAQTCVGEAIYACFTENVHFYLQDIDSTYLNALQAPYVWDYYGKLRGKPLTCTYQLVLGTPTETRLPANQLDKVLIINSFHEFTEPALMLADIATKLKRGGILYIDEFVPHKAGQLHGSCRKPLYNQQQLDNLLSKAGFTSVTGYTVDWRKGKANRYIYAYIRQ